MKNQKMFFTALFLLGASLFSQAQSVQVQPINTAVPFLNYSPDARASAMGECGVATDADAFSMFYNPAKYAFMEQKHTMISTGFALYSSPLTSPRPVLLLDAFAQKIGNSAIAATARYYSSESIELRDEYNNYLGEYRPREFAFDVAYAYRFGEYFSAGVAGRLIYSSLFGMGYYNSTEALSVAGDVSAYYKRPLGRVVDLSLGASITNIGTKMRYFSYSKKDFIPTTLRLGSGVKFKFNQNNSLAVNLQFSKLLVPSTPIIARDPVSGQPIVDPNTGEYQIQYGYDNNVSVFKGMIQSFYDAPGHGYNYEGMIVDFPGGTFYEELCEINTGIGLEYNLFNHGFFRCGYYHQPALKGGAKRVSLGAGMRFGIFGMDVSYTIPVNTVVGTNPYENSIRWDMYFAF